MSEFWRFVESNLPLILAVLSLGTFIGIAANALISLLNYRSTKRDNLPLVHATQPKPQADLNYWLSFKMETESKKWLVAGIRIRRQWRCHLAKPTEQIWHGGHFRGFETGPWSRHIRFDPPDSEGYVLLHRDTPKAFWLCFDVCSSSDPKAKKLVVKRVVITD